MPRPRLGRLRRLLLRLVEEGGGDALLPRGRLLLRLLLLLQQRRVVVGQRPRLRGMRLLLPDEERGGGVGSVGDRGGEVDGGGGQAV